MRRGPTEQEYDPESPLWWGIERNGKPDAKKLAAVVEAAIRIARPERIILFGSGARGTMNGDSDLDILIIAETEDRRATARRIRNARPRRCAPLDITVITAGEVELNSDDECCFIQVALQEGRVLYEADREEERRKAKTIPDDMEINEHQEIDRIGTRVLGPKKFEDEYASADPEFANEGRGPDSDAIRGLIAGSCCGWRSPPTGEEFFEAMRASAPTERQQVVAGAVVAQASNDTLALAYLQGAFTWRQVASALRRRGAYSSRQAMYVNLHAAKGQGP